MIELCYVNGRVAPISEPVVRADDAGFQLGLSVFDTVLYEDGCYYFLEHHLDRLRNGSRDLSIEWPANLHPVECLQELRDAIGGDSLALRMTMTRGPAGGEPTFIITAREIVRPADPGAVLAIASERRMGGDPMGRLKSTNRLPYILAREEATERGAFEALFLSHDGDALEGTISNFFCVIDGVLATASLDRGCLPGTIRGILLAELKREPLEVDGKLLEVREGRVSTPELGQASEMFLTNTTGRILPIRKLLGPGDSVRELPGSAGAVTQAIRERLGRVERAYRVAQLKNGL